MTIRVTENDYSPDSRVRVLKFGNGQITIDGSTAIITITGGGDGGSSLFLMPNGVSVSTLNFPVSEFNIFHDGVSGATITVRGSSGTWSAAQTFGSSTTFLDLARGTTFYLFQVVIGSNNYAGTIPFSIFKDSASPYVNFNVASESKTVVFNYTGAAQTWVVPDTPAEDSRNCSSEALS